ncbi:vitamin K-dependent protein S-like isoform X2 [Phalaenopsis equestris]|nr:vitamin K-dependent protein S-like isoform X2 [Phalaenopsis equestris]
MLNLDVMTRTTVICGHSKVGLIREADEVFDEMPDRNIVCSNRVIISYNKKGLICLHSMFLGANNVDLQISLTKSTSSIPKLDANHADVDEDLCGNVDCGRGICKSPAANMAGFVCVCEPGWSQLHFGNHFRFLPCNIPDCDYQFSCYNESLDHSKPPFLNSTAGNIFDPCFWSFCGEGECERISAFDHKCKCKEGYSNLLNISNFPCIKECMLDANCDNLGYSLTNSTPSSSPKVDSNHSEGSVFTANLLRLLLVLITIVAASPPL